jgi:PQQ-like domain
MRGYSSSCVRLALVLAVLSVAACSSGTGARQPGPGGGRAASGRPSLRAYDPPLKFDAQHRIALQHVVAAPRAYALPDVPPLLVGARTFAYSSDGGLIATDLVSGKDLAVFPSATAQGTPGGALRDDSDLGGYWRRPAAVTVNGRTLVVVTLVGTLPGAGMSPDKPVARMIAVDSQTLKPLRLNDIDLTPFNSQLTSDPSSGGPASCSQGDLSCAIVGGVGNVLVVTAGTFTAAIDITTGNPTWTSYSVHALGVIGGQVVAVAARQPDPFLTRNWDERDHYLTGLDLRTGHTSWSNQDYVVRTDMQGGAYLAPQIFDVAPAEALVIDSTTAQIINTATGAALHTMDTTRSRCLYDDASVLVCEDAGVTAYDAASGNKLWSLPAPGRVVIMLAAAWHGAIYGRPANSSSANVVLDARTGQTRQLDSGVTPTVVDQYAAIVAPLLPSSLADPPYAYLAVG